MQARLAVPEPGDRSSQRPVPRDQPRHEQVHQLHRQVRATSSPTSPARRRPRRPRSAPVEHDRRAGQPADGARRIDPAACRGSCAWRTRRSSTCATPWTIVQPLVDVTKPVAPKLQKLLVQLKPLAEDSVPTVRDLANIVSRPGPDNDLIELTKLGVPLAAVTVHNVNANGKLRPGAFTAVDGRAQRLDAGARHGASVRGRPHRLVRGLHASRRDRRQRRQQPRGPGGRRSRRSRTDSRALSRRRSPASCGSSSAPGLRAGNGSVDAPGRATAARARWSAGRIYFPESGFPCNPNEVPTGLMRAYPPERRDHRWRLVRSWSSPAAPRTAAALPVPTRSTSTTRSVWSAARTSRSPAFRRERSSRSAFRTGASRETPMTATPQVTVQVTQNGFGPFRTDAFCQSRPQSLIGEYFIECQPGQNGKVDSRGRDDPGHTHPIDDPGRPAAGRHAAALPRAVHADRQRARRRGRRPLG